MAWQRLHLARWLVGVVAFVLVACGTEPASAPSAHVTINELMSSGNLDYEIVGTGSTPDWIELYNAGDEDVDLRGYYMGDSARHRLEFRLPAGLVVPANGFKILWADNYAFDIFQPDGGLEHVVEPGHLDFALSAEGEAVWLTDPKGYVLSYTEFGPYPLADAGNAEASWARFPDGTGEFEWCTKPTFNRPNGVGCPGQVVR
jgi:hypothetical protein